MKNTTYAIAVSGVALVILGVSALFIRADRVLKAAAQPGNVASAPTPGYREICIDGRATVTRNLGVLCWLKPEYSHD